MAIKIYNKANSSWSKTDGKPSVNFGSAGIISLNRSVVDALSLKAGDKVSIGEDDQDPRTFFLFKDKDNGFELRDYNKSGALAFNCALVTKAARGNYEDERKSVTGKLITEPQMVDKVKYYPIILPKAE